MPRFELESDYNPCGDQPKAIDQLVMGLRRGERHQTLLGVTGSGKTFTIANVIKLVQRPTLVISHNKTLAAQLCSEFRAFFPKNAVEYFVSYYDYYKPEAYLPEIDMYIEKDFSINDEIDRLRHRTTQALLTRRDVIIVASVSCIYSLGNPDDYRKTAFTLQRGQTIRRDDLLRKLIDMRYERNDRSLERGKFRVRGDIVEVCQVEERLTRVELLGNKIDRLSEMHPTTGELIEEREVSFIFPAKHFIMLEERMKQGLKNIAKELDIRLEHFRSRGKLLEAQRLEQRTNLDIEMIEETGYCQGIENYSRFFDGRSSGQPPFTLIDYFPEDFLTVIDESHVTVPQLQGMFNADRSRKETLVKYGFRLPSAKDNRPLSFEEFESAMGQVIYTSATPGPYELEYSKGVVEQIIRPTGLVDPQVILRSAEGQVSDLIKEIEGRVKREERVLVTTLTKRMAEGLADYLKEKRIKVHYLHSEVETLKRMELIRDLRLGEFDVLVGINLLREGLDLPEVSLVAILDADRQGFLRSGTALIQTMGRASRNVFGQVIMYSDDVTPAMRQAIDETNRRRRLQLSHNKKHGITPMTVRKDVRAVLAQSAPIAETTTTGFGKYAKDKLDIIIANLEEEMRLAAKNLEFERAAEIRDKIKELRMTKVQLMEKIEKKRKGRVSR